MWVKLQIAKKGTTLYARDHDITDADSFAAACAEAWSKLRQAQIDKESSIGALMEYLDSSVLDQLNGAHITLEKPDPKT